MTSAEEKKALRDAAEEIRNLASDSDDKRAEFLLNLAAVVERMDPVPLRG
jgi:hypothetical protein